MLVVDADPQGNATTGLGIRKTQLERDVYDVLLQEASIDDVAVATEIEGLFARARDDQSCGAEIELVSAMSRETRLRQAVSPVADRYDFVLIDCPPSLGLLTINALTAAHECLIPVQAEYYALEGLSQLTAVVARVREALNPSLRVSGVLVTMFDGRTRLAAEVFEELVKFFPDQIFKTQIPRNVRISEAPSFGKPVILFDPKSRGAQAYVALAREVLEPAGSPRMSAPRRGLGRGLGALLGDSAARAGADREPPREIPVDRITPNPYQPRKSFERDPLDELQASIAEYGVLVPIIVRRRGDAYELIAGERRWRACASLGLATIPAILRTSDDRDALEVALIENLQRENLNPLEEAAGFQHLIDEFGLTQEEVARRVGKSRPAVTNALRLLALPDGVKAMVAGGRLSPGHARALLAAAPADRAGARASAPCATH